ncbi:MAG: response regulator transcription factor [Anaerolineae bacterium]|nr:response regulator transcription factor [Anaerolineae bacterium]
MVKILLAEDHTMVRAGIRLVISELDGFEVIGEADDGQQALEMTLKLKPDIVVMDIAMPRLNGLDAAERILRDCPGVKIAILSMYSTEQYVKRALQVGVSAYLLKKSAVAELQLAFQAMLRGERYLSPPIADMVVNELLSPRVDTSGGTESLTTREREIMQMIAEGYANQDIADHLSLSVHTVRTHRGNLMQKLNLHNQADIVRYAIQTGLIQPPE